MKKLQESVNLLTFFCVLIIVVQMASCAYMTKDHDIITAAVWKNGWEITGKCGP